METNDSIIATIAESAEVANKNSFSALFPNRINSFELSKIYQGIAIYSRGLTIFADLNTYLQIF